MSDSNPISRLHPSQKDKSSTRQLGERVVSLLKEASGKKLARAAKLSQLIGANIWSVKEFNKNIIVTVNYSKSSYRPDWRITLKAGKVSKVEEVGELDEDTPSDVPVMVSGKF